MSASLADTRSSELYRRALEVIPGGVNSPVRAMRSIGRDPIFIARGEGAELIDVDANRFIDYVCSWGPLIHGHAHPHILAAVTAAAVKGTSFGAPTPGEVELASEVVRRMESVEMLRMTSSGTEAAMTAIRLARAATGREPILKFAGAYHGHSDGLLAQAGSGMATQALPASPGVPASAAAATIVVPWNDRDALVAATEQHELAAILAEPVPANMGVVAPDAGFLALVRERADANGALLVLDEVISGFRVARGGAQELLGVSGDLVILGKIIGGGLPAAALGGRAELMRMLAPSGEVYQAGTLSGNPVAVAAGLATLELLDEPAYLRLAAVTERLADGLREAARDAAGPGGAGGIQSKCHNARADDGVLQRAARRLLRRRPELRSGRVCRVVPGAARTRRVPAASQFEAWFPSLAHTQSRSSAPSKPPPLRSRACSSLQVNDERRGRAARGGALESLRALLRREGGLIATLVAPAGSSARATPGVRRASLPGTARRRQPRASTSCWSRRSTRDTSCTTAHRASSTWQRPTCVCSRVIGCTRSGSRVWLHSATPQPCPSSPTRSR